VTQPKTLTPDDGYEFELAAKMISYYGKINRHDIAWLIRTKWGDSGSGYRFQMKDGRTADIDLGAPHRAAHVTWEERRERR
jgi:hypothetical protein